MNSDDIPSEIWHEILVRLPAESLFRTRAVCTGFRAMINDPCFVRAHTKKHQQQLSSSRIIFLNQNGPLYSLDLEALSFSNGHQAIAARPLDLDLTSDMAACNGLILTQKPLAICNPLTQERLDLPDPANFSDARDFGLGYDCATDDYKAVVILGTLDTHVYSLKRDSWRRIINFPCDGDWQGATGPGVFVSGALNWLPIRKGVYDEKIVALDMGTEKYSVLQIPLQTSINRPRTLCHDIDLTVLGGCLALSECLAIPEIGCCGFLYVWVLKDYRDEDSWIKLLTIRGQPCIPKWSSGFLMPVAFFRKERLVFLQDETRRFFLFDVETKSMKWAVIDGSGVHLYARQMFAGTIFRLHANCGGGVRKKMRKIAGCPQKKRKIASCTKKKRKITSCTKKKRKITSWPKKMRKIAGCAKKKRKIASCTKKKACADRELVFCFRDANGDFDGSCCERGLSGENKDGTKLLEDSICS